MNILLINDSPIVNNIIQNCLDGNITTTSNGNIDIPSNTNLIIFNIELHTDNIINSKIPSIMLCTGSDDSKRIELLMKDTNKIQYVVKPFTCEELNGKVSMVVQ
jgi:response regulator RpfG family c-di-GMP phosphodiesterase